MESATNVRRHERHDLDAAIEVRSRDIEGQKVSATGSCVNISKGGLMMQVPRAIPVLSHVTFRIARLDFEGTGTVRHCGNTGAYCLVGVEFDDGQCYDPASG